MDLEAIRELAFKHMANRRAHKEREIGFIYYHGQRVAKIAVKLRKLLIPDDPSRDQELTAAGYFHDIAKGIEPHSVYGAVLVREILAEHCTPEQLDFISDLIRHHQFRDPSKGYHDYIKIIQDADILDHVGVVEIWMNFQYCAHADMTLTDSIRFYETEFPALAAKIRSLLNYDLSRQIFDDKCRFVMDFVNRMKVEADGEIFNLDSLRSDAHD